MANNVPRFFGLRQSSKISFKIPSVGGVKRLGDGNTIPDDAIPPRKDYSTDFTINENSKLGVPKIYTPEQIYNYKSQWARYEKGIELVQSGKILKNNNNDGNNNVSNNKEIYKILSSTAPSGYWNVKQKKQDTLNYGVLLRVLTAFKTTRSGNVTYPFGSMDDYFEGSGEYNGLGVSAKYNSFVTIKQDENGKSYYELNSTVEAKGDLNLVSAGGRIGIISNINAINITASLEYQIEIILTNAAIDYDNGAASGAKIFNNSITKTNGDILVGGTIQGEGISAQNSYGGDYGHGINFPNVFYGFAPSYSYVKLTQKIKILEVVFEDGSKGSGGGGGGDGGGEPGNNEDGSGENNGNNGNNGNKGNNNWECNCPDASKEKYISPTDISGNEEAYKSWKDSDAGAPNGICKHIWAVRILNRQVGNGEGQIPIPTDMPIEIIPWPGNQSPQVANPGFGGFKNWRMNKTTKGDKF